MKIAVVFQSQTGNTRSLAQVIQDSIPPQTLIYIGQPDVSALKADLIFAGSWTDKGNFAPEMADFLKLCHGKQIFLFGTAGFGGAPDYFQAILQRVTSLIPTDNQISGTFYCQGKMPASVLERYQQLLQQQPENERWALMIENFHQAESHPDAQDLNRCRQAVCQLLNQLPDQR